MLNRCTTWVCVEVCDVTLLYKWLLYDFFVVVVQYDVIREEVCKLFEDVWVSFAFEPVMQLSFEVRFFKDEIVHEPNDDDAPDDEP